MAAGCIVDEVVVSAITSGGPTQTISLTLEGETPKLVVFYVFGTTSDGAADDALCSYGFTDGTNQVCVSMASEHGVNPTNTWRDFVTDEVILVMDPNSGAVDGEAHIHSLGANQVVINWGNLPASAWKVGVWALAGSAVSAVVTQRTGSGSLNGTDTYSHGLSSTPTGMIALTTGSSLNAGAGPAAKGRISVGYASYDGSSIDQCSTSLYLVDNDSTGLISGRADSQRITCPPWYSSGGLTETSEPHLEVTSVTSSNVVLTTRESGVAADYGLAVITGCFCFARLREFETGTGVKNFDLPAGYTDFYPKGALIGATRINYSHINANRTNNVAATIGWGGMGTEKGGSNVPGEHMGSVSQQRNTVPANTQSSYNSQILDLPTHNGSTGHQGAWNNYDTDGYGINVTSGVSSTKAVAQLIVGVQRLEATSLTSSSAFSSASLLLVLQPSSLASSSTFGTRQILDPVSQDVDASSLVSSSAFGHVTVFYSSVRTNGPRALIVLAGSVAARFALSGSISSRLVASGSVAGRLAAVRLGLGRLNVAGSAAGRLVVAGSLAGQLQIAGSVAGRVAEASTTSGKVVVSGPVAGRIVASGSVAGRIVVASSVAGRISHAQ